MDSKLGVQHGHHHHNGVSKPPVHHHHHHHGRRGGGRHHGGGGGGGKQGIKVVYISSPMKLIASAEEFRAVVQELTGRDSNVADHDLAGAAHAAEGAPSSSSYSSYSYGRASPTAAAGAAAGAGALPSTMMMPTATSGSGLGAEYAAGVAAPAAFQGSMYDQTAGSLLYGQDYW
ncbi:hypothetical protein ACP70R_014053 [Stipagrostis hirtigluma subsp. patula]